MLELLLPHDTLLFEALEGVMVALNVSVSPTSRDIELLFRDTPVTGTVDALTVTVQVAVLPPSTVVTVMVAVPVATALTVPLWLTVATEVALLLYDTLLLVALEGVTTAINVSELLTVRLVVDLFKVTFVTATEDEVTVTEQVAVLLPSTVVTVIVVLPADIPVTAPL
jgi:hypothetical protein